MGASDCLNLDSALLAGRRGRPCVRSISSQSIVQATRINDLYQVNEVCSIEPKLLEKFAQAVPDALVGVANAEQKEPPGFWGVLKIFRSENLRRGLAVVNNLLEAWGRNFSTQRNS